MADSFFTTQKDSELAASSANFATKISATPTAYGLVAAQATAYATLNTAFQTAYTTSLAPSTRTKSAVAAKNSARAPLRVMASELARIITATPTVTDAQKIDLGITVRATPARRPDPGTPSDFIALLSVDGSVTLKWKCHNPVGSSGTIYQVWRKIDAETVYAYVGGVGLKKFVDATIPAGSKHVTYQIQAVRSTAQGEWAQFNVNFGVAPGGTMIESVEEAPLKRAA